MAKKSNSYKMCNKLHVKDLACRSDNLHVHVFELGKYGWKINSCE